MWLFQSSNKGVWKLKKMYFNVWWSDVIVYLMIPIFKGGSMEAKKTMVIGDAEKIEAGCVVQEVKKIK